MLTGLEQLTKYAAYHRDRRNIATHVIGVPMIVFSVCILLARPQFTVAGLIVSPIVAAWLVSGIYYILLDRSLGVLLTLLLLLMLAMAQLIAAQSTATWLVAGMGLFVLGWIVQFVGHHYEGRKPAFVDDLIGLLIGPLFVLAELVFALGFRRPLQNDIEARVGPTLIRVIPTPTQV